MAETLTLQSGGSEMKVYEVKPEGEARGAMIVLQEAFGMTAHVKDITERFAAEGFHSVAPHLFHRTGDPVIPYDEMQKVMPNIMKMEQQSIEDDVGACIAHLEDQGFKPGQIGVIGFCMGGTMSFFAAVKWPLGAAITCYGGGVTQGRFGLDSLIDMAGDLKAPWQGHYGDLDQSIPFTEVELLGRKAAKVASDNEMFRYPDADHGFHCKDRSQYHAESAAQSWDRIVAFVKKHIGSD